MLYTVNKSPLSTASLASVLRIAPEGAPILLYEDGVYAAVNGAKSTPIIQDALGAHPIYALDAGTGHRQGTGRHPGHWLRWIRGIGGAARRRSLAIETRQQGEHSWTSKQTRFRTR
jgi:sulfur transfer complex TusBCD TusB component (DsrH family)